MVNAPRKAGTKFEGQVVKHAQEKGFAWDRAPLRGVRDLLDVQGCMPDGWLVGCKAIGRGVDPARKLSEAMNQAQNALNNARRMYGEQSVADLKAVQIIQRAATPGQRADIGNSYAVMSYDTFLELVREVREARAHLWGASHDQDLPE